MPTSAVRAFPCALFSTLMCLAVLPGHASAHATVTPGEAPTRAYQRYVLRVPNERGEATVRVHIVFPAGLRVISFDEVPGWTLETTSPDGTAFASATWSGTLPAGRFVEFGFIGVNPEEPTTLVWPVVQTYADGFLAEWTGPSDSSTPASTTRIVGLDAAPAAPEGGPTGGTGGSTATLLAAAALVLALVSLGLALRPSRAA